MQDKVHLVMCKVNVQRCTTVESLFTLTTKGMRMSGEGQLNSSRIFYSLRKENRRNVYLTLKKGKGKKKKRK